MDEDSYRTIAAPTRTALRERSSKFIAYALPVTTEEEIKQHLTALRKEHYDATHHCYAWRLGPKGEQYRVNDDGEPSGSAGKPILGQMLSNELTDLLIVVVRYFGGTKLGVPGLIAAYKDSAAEVIAGAQITEKTVDVTLDIEFPYQVINDVMRVVKEIEPRVHCQDFNNVCRMKLSIRQAESEALIAKLAKAEGITIQIR